MQLVTYETRERADQALADEIGHLVRERRAERKNGVFGFATGHTPIPLYAELVRRIEAGELDLSDIVTFNLDEYVGLSRRHPSSFYHYMQTHLFRAAGIPETRIHFPTSATKSGGEGDARSCEAFEQRIREFGGIDLQILGIGSNGHVAFNEPGSAPDSRTRVVALKQGTRSDNARDFSDAVDVPTHAVSMGIATILEAKRLRLLAFGERKVPIIRRLFSEPASVDLPASLLRDHPDFQVLTDFAL